MADILLLRLEGILKSWEEIPEDIRITQNIRLTDLGLDSLEIGEFGCAIEKELEIQIPYKKLFSFETMNDIQKYIKEKYPNKDF